MARWFCSNSGGDLKMHYEETDGIGVLDSVKNLGGVGRGSVDGTGACLRCSNTTGRANRASRKEET